MSPFAFTCLLPVWAGDAPESFLEAARSVETSTLPPDEILICQDGQLSHQGLERVVEGLLQNPRYRLTVNEGPRGLHHNLNRAADAVRTPWIARMDADDLNRPDRFAAQVAFLAANPGVDVLGGSILEVAEHGSARRRRVTPLTHSDIVRRANWRSPMNHMTVFMRRETFLAAGGYPNLARKEDYALWLRMIAMGAIFANLPQDLVEVRIGHDFARRRAGPASVVSEYQLYVMRRGREGPAGLLEAAVSSWPGRPLCPPPPWPPYCIARCFGERFRICAIAIGLRTSAMTSSRRSPGCGDSSSSWAGQSFVGMSNATPRARQPGRAVERRSLGEDPRRRTQAPQAPDDARRPKRSAARQTKL